MDWEIILSIIAIIISILTLFLQLIHNKKTLKPLININTGDYEDDIFVDIENKGLGPLIIKKVEIYRFGVLCEENDLHKIIKTGGQPWYTFMEKLEGRTIPANEKIRIIGIQPETETIKTTIRRTLKDISYKVTFEDIYGKVYERTEEFNFYNRHFIR